MIKILGVVGTWVLAILAIWGDKIRSLLFQPKLRLELRNNVGELTRQTVHWMTPAGPQERSSNARYYHVLLKNVSAARFPLAREAHVIIAQIETQGPDGQPRPAFVGMLPLRWASGNGSDADKDGWTRENSRPLKGTRRWKPWGGKLK